MNTLKYIENSFSVRLFFLGGGVGKGGTMGIWICSGHG